MFKMIPNFRFSQTSYHFLVHHLLQFGVKRATEQLSKCDLVCRVGLPWDSLTAGLTLSHSKILVYSTMIMLFVLSYKCLVHSYLILPSISAVMTFYFSSICMHLSCYLETARRRSCVLSTIGLGVPLPTTKFPMQIPLQRDDIT